MDTLSPPETRGRSRSKTPFLRSSCDRELCSQLDHNHIHERKVKKSPLVQTIMEEGVEQSSPVSSQHFQSSSSQKSSRVVTSDYSSEEISPNLAQARGNAVKKTTYVTESYTISRSGQSNNLHNSAAGKNSPSSILLPDSRAAIKSKETSQNEINSAFEESTMKTSTPILIGNSRKLQFSSPPSNGQASDHISYNEYREAGEYWNKVPKTDYTYSRLSPHRRELAPGVIAMPNMSRKSLDKHSERIGYMIKQNPAQEAYIRQRYDTTRHTTTTTTNRKTTKVQQDVYYDSQDEVDLDQQYNNYRQSRSNRYLKSNYATVMRQESFITRFLTTIVSLFTRVTSIFWRNEENLYYTRIEEKKGFFSRFLSAISTIILSIFRPLYMAISSILYLDTWLLRSSSADSRTKKRFLLFLLLLLPLLLLGGWCLMDEQERHAIILRSQSLIPISLIGFRSIFPSNWRDIFKLNLHFTTQTIPASSSQYNYESITNNLQKSLSAEEYDSIINHINGYVQQLVDTKLANERQQFAERENKISKEMSLLIANIVRENIVVHTPSTVVTATHQNYELSDADIEKIVELVRIKLASVSSDTRPAISLTQENLEEISKLIKSNIEVNNQHFNIIERIDIDELLYKILKSPQLHEFIHKQVSDTSEKDILDRQQLVIDELNKEIQLIKAQLAGNLMENQGLHHSVDMLKSTQDEFIQKFGSFETNTNAKFNNLLAEIDAKFVALDKQHFTMINKQIKLALVDILGYKNGKNIDDIDLQNWVRNMFVAKEFLEERLTSINIEANQHLKEELERSGMLLMKDISEKMKIEILKTIEFKQKDYSEENNEFRSGLTELEIKKIVGDALAVYDADKTGLVDYALESAGGQVVSTRCTENYQTKSAQISIFGIPLWYPSNTPRIAIAPAVSPGDCWAFQGFPGYLVIKLNTRIYVTGFTLEHIPKSLAPNGKIDSAPRNFSVLGLVNEKDQDGTLLGEYEYLDNGVALQYFPVLNKTIESSFDVVELQITTNHGNQGYSCLYRFRVHGTPSPV